MAYIYKITNQLNNKIYIGKTLLTPEKRFKEHCRDAFKATEKHRPLYSAMNKYGIENFKIEVVEECNDKILSDREKYWIEYYGSFKNGYNATIGGDGKPYLDYNLICETYKNVNNLKLTANLCHCNEDSVRNILNERAIQIKTSEEILKELYSKLVNQYDKNDNYIQSFSSLTEAAKWLKENQKAQGELRGILSHIRDTANGKRKSAYNYHWKFPNN